VESAVADALKGVSARDRAAARRVLGRLARHLEPAAARGHAPASGPNQRRAGYRKGVGPHA
jgi:hypothetical protein